MELFLAAVLKPIIWFLTISTNAVLRLVGIDPHEKEEPVSEEDIVLMLDAGADEGSLDHDDIEYIKNVFKLDKMTAEDVMTPRKSVISISYDASDEEILEIIEEESYSRIPVYEDNPDKIIGILHACDYLLKRNEKNLGQMDQDCVGKENPGWPDSGCDSGNCCTAGNRNRNSG